jgi:hypothetical protein
MIHLITNCEDQACTQDQEFISVHATTHQIFLIYER